MLYETRGKETTIKLNLHVIWDELQGYGGEIICTDDIRSTLQGVRYFVRSNTALEERYLYLADAETLRHIPADIGQHSFVCTGEIDQAMLNDRGWSAIVLPNGADRHKVFRDIQEVFEKFVQWEQDMLLAIASGESLQSIFDCGVRFLRNPIALFDTSSIFIMMAGSLPANIEGTIWEDVLSKGYSRLENYPVEEQRTMARLFEEYEEPFFNQTQGKYSKNQQILASLKRNDTRFGTFGMIDIAEPFTLGQLSVVSYLKTFMELAFEEDIYLASTLEDPGYFVERLLQDFWVERNAVAYHLTKRGWHIEDSFCLVYFVKADNTPIDGDIDDIYAFRIRSLLEDAIVFTYENGILAVSHGANRIRADATFAGELSLLLENLGLRGGVSLPFDDFMELKYAYIQCKTALASPPDESEGSVRLFEKHYTSHIIQALDASTSLKSLCHPQILRLYRAEGGKGPEYVHSLQTYLGHARNKTAAANSLFIHRNTLLYRLGRIEEMLEIDLETADEQTLFMLYLSCVIANHFS